MLAEGALGVEAAEGAAVVAEDELEVARRERRGRVVGRRERGERVGGRRAEELRRGAGGEARGEERYKLVEARADILLRGGGGGS